MHSIRIKNSGAALIAALFITAVAASLAGCGGDRKKAEATVDTGSSSGTLRGVQINPPPGEVFISRKTVFQISWTPENPPPPQFTAVLMRYREARGDEERVTEEQRTELTRIGESFTWNLRRSDAFDLDTSGVYFVQLRSGGEEYARTYIVSSERSASAPTSGGAFTHSVTVR